MEKYYRPALSGDDVFDPRMFSYFKELIDGKSRIDALIANKYTKTDFAKWVIKGNVNSAGSVRKLPAVLGNKQAKEEFLKTNISEAMKYLDVPGTNGGLLENATYVQLANELSKKLGTLPFTEVQRLKNQSESTNRDSLFDLKDSLEGIIKFISSESVD